MGEPKGTAGCRRREDGAGTRRGDDRRRAPPQALSGRTYTSLLGAAVLRHRSPWTVPECTGHTGTHTPDPRTQLCTKGSLRAHIPDPVQPCSDPVPREPDHWVASPQESQPTGKPAYWVASPQGSQPTREPAHWVVSPQRSQPTGEPTHWVASPQGSQPTGEGASGDWHVMDDSAAPLQLSRADTRHRAPSSRSLGPKPTGQ